jgi:DNA-binding response OmpR family regulator/Tfp pilus assembly protein PilZ
VRRLVVVARDPALTRFVGESLLRRSLEAFVPRPDDPWEVARAHTGLELMVLLTRSPEPYDVVLIDHDLPDTTFVRLIERIRDEGLNLPIVLMTERGRDLHSRRQVADRFEVGGFLERPVSVESLRHVLEMLLRRRRVMVVDEQRERREEFHRMLTRANYYVELAGSGDEALARFPAARPDIVVLSLSLDDAVSLGADIKKRAQPQPVPVVLHGLPSALPVDSVDENAFRADDFLPAPFDAQLLVERVAAQVGVSRPATPAETPISTDVPEAPAPAATRRELPTSPRSPGKPGSTVSAPPPSASPAPSAPSHRLTRRVPCGVRLQVREGDRAVTSQTLDISHGGIYFEMPEPLDVGAVVDLTFELPNSDDTVHAVGRVAWASESGVGVKFSRIDKNDLQYIVEYVNSVARVLYNPN